MYIKVYVSDEEKKILESIALSKGISISRLCYEQIAPLLSNYTDFSIDSCKKTDDMKLNHHVKVYFTENEYQNLMFDSKGIPLSRFLRREYLNRKNPIVISVYTDDIEALSLKVSAYIERLNNFIAALALRQQLYEADYQRLIQIAEDTKTALKDVATYSRNNRKSIRSSGIRILQTEIKRALETKLKGRDAI